MVKHTNYNYNYNFKFNFFVEFRIYARSAYRAYDLFALDTEFLECGVQIRLEWRFKLVVDSLFSRQEEITLGH